jgi:hypothetical protein
MSARPSPRGGRVLRFRHKEDGRYTACKNALISTAIMSKNRGKSKLSKSVLFNANKHVFHCEKSLGTLFYGQSSYILFSYSM